MPYVTNEDLFPIWREPRSFWERTGLSAEQQRRLNVGLLGVVLLLSAGWVYSAAVALQRGDAPVIARRIGAEPSILAPDAAPPTAFLLDAALRQLTPSLDEFRGESGALNVVLVEPGDTGAVLDSLPAGVELGYRSTGTADSASGALPAQPGIWNVVLRMRDAVREVPRMTLITQVPASEARGGRIGSYLVGSWPEKVSGVPTPENYRPPRGFIRVTPENRNVRISEHFTLGEFLTKGQADVWPKYVVINPRVVDKAELTIRELKEMGHPVERVGVISAFRTPSYNASGGDTSGRGALSRHMYGDAIDFFVDNDGDFRMDDLNGDGRVTVADARVMAEAAERVEKKYPSLIGGIGTYAPTGAHAGFIHVDTRGYRARW